MHIELFIAHALVCLVTSPRQLVNACGYMVICLNFLSWYVMAGYILYITITVIH